MTAQPNDWTHEPVPYWPTDRWSQVDDRAVEFYLAHATLEPASNLDRLDAGERPEQWCGCGHELEFHDHFSTSTHCAASDEDGPCDCEVFTSASAGRWVTGLAMVLGVLLLAVVAYGMGVGR